MSIICRYVKSDSEIIKIQHLVIFLYYGPMYYDAHLQMGWISIHWENDWQYNYYFLCLVEIDYVIIDK